MMAPDMFVRARLNEVEAMLREFVALFAGAYPAIKRMGKVGMPVGG
jgi:hypothetical protein